MAIADTYGHDTILTQTEFMYIITPCRTQRTGFEPWEIVASCVIGSCLNSPFKMTKINVKSH
jgi:hypothetical protein